MSFERNAQNLIPDVEILHNVRSVEQQPLSCAMHQAGNQLRNLVKMCNEHTTPMNTKAMTSTVAGPTWRPSPSPPDQFVIPPPAVAPLRPLRVAATSDRPDRLAR